MLRENLVLEALDIEKQVDLQFKTLQIENAFASFYDPKKVRHVLQELQRQFVRLTKAATFDPTATQNAVAKGSIEAISKLYYALAKSGLVDDVADETPA